MLGTTDPSVTESKEQRQYLLTSLQQADQQLFKHQTENAIELLKRIIEQNQPERQHEVLGWGSVAQQKSCYEKSIIQWYREQRSERKEAVTPYDCLCLCYTINKNYQNSEEYYTQMLQTYPQNTAFILSLAHIHFNQGKIDLAKNLYVQLLKNQKQKKHASKQLAILAFYDDNRTQIARHLQQLKNVDDDYTLKFLKAYVQSQQQRLILYDELISKYPSYVRSYLFKAYTLESQNKKEEAHQCYLDCIKRNKKYCAPYIQLAFSYIQRGEVQEAIKLLKSNQNYKWDDDILIDFLLSFAYFRTERFQESKKHIHKLLDSIQTKNFCLTASTQLFLQKLFTKVLAIIQKFEHQQEYSWKNYEEVDKWHDYMLQMHSIKQQHLNVRMEKILKEALQPIQITKFYFLNKCKLDRELVSKLFLSNIDQRYLIQLTNALIMKSAKNGLLSREKSIVDLNKDIFTLFIQIANQQEVIDKDTNKYQRDESLKVYSIRYKPKTYNMLQGKDYFSGFQHLFTIFKQFRKQVQIAKQDAEFIAKDICSKFNPTYYKIQTRFNSSDVELAINEIMSEIFTQIKSKGLDIMQSINNLIQKLQKVQHKDLIQAYKQSTQKVFQKIIKERFQKKAPTVCLISNWVELWFIFDNKRLVVQAIQLIEQQCKYYNHQVHGFQGASFLSYQSKISIKLKILNVCITINLGLCKNFNRLFLKNYAKSMLNQNLSPFMKSLIDFKRIYQYPLAECFEQHLEYEQLEHNQTNQELIVRQKVKQFLRQIKYEDIDQNAERSQQLSFIRQNGEKMQKLNKSSTENVLKKGNQFSVDQSSGDASYFEQHPNSTKKRSYKHSGSNYLELDVLNQSALQKTFRNFDKNSDRSFIRVKTDYNKEINNGARKNANRLAKLQLISNSINILISQKHKSVEEQAILQLKNILQLEKAQLLDKIKTLEQNLQTVESQKHQKQNKFELETNQYETRRQTQINIHQQEQQKLRQQNIGNYTIIQTLKDEKNQLNIKNNQLKIQIQRLKDEITQQQTNIFKVKISQIEQKYIKSEQQIKKLIKANNQLTKKLQSKTKNQELLNHRYESESTKNKQVLREFQNHKSKYLQKQKETIKINRIVEEYKRNQENFKVQIQSLNKKLAETKQGLLKIQNKQKAEKRGKQEQDEKQQPKKQIVQNSLHLTVNNINENHQKNISTEQTTITYNKIPKERKDRNVNKDKVQTTIENLNGHPNSKNEKIINENLRKQTTEQLIQTQRAQKSQIVQQISAKQPQQKIKSCYQGSLCKNAKSLSKKIQYLKVVFLILLFEAITLTFTSKMFG